MFHLAKRVTTETEWEYVQKQKADLLTDIENIGNTISMDWLGCKVMWEEERTGTGLEDDYLYRNMVVMDYVVDGSKKLYIAECL